MLGRMMDFPLLLSHFLDRAAKFFPRREIVSRRPDGSLHRYHYADFCHRSAQLAHALGKLGVGRGDRVATLSWNHHRHLEAYFAVPSMGAVLHTLNLRLHPDELAFIARHAEDTVVIVDRSLLGLLGKFRERVPSLRQVIVVPDDGPVDPAQGLDYEALIAGEPTRYEWPRLDENEAAMLCYTSGTTGNPKGVLYSHRSTCLHTIATGMCDGLAVSQNDTVLPVVPMFHANAWGLPFIAVCVGAKLVFPGPKLDPPSLLDLMAAEKVTCSGGVPTIWLGILALLDAAPHKYDLSSMRRMAVGGSAAPPSLIAGFERHGLEVLHAWGMTETSPVGTVAILKAEMRDKPEAEQLAVRASQGFATPFVEQRHVGESGEVLAWDGATMGELEVRGPWVAASYFGDSGKDRWTDDGWFKTGDVVTIDAEGYVRITDRAKDVIKSGGEWISSVALENALMSHPAVLEAAVFAGRDAKWGERPLAAVVPKPGMAVSGDELNAHLASHFARFWLPEAYFMLASIPRTSTGKFLKTKLRELYGDHLLKKEPT